MTRTNRAGKRPSLEMRLLEMIGNNGSFDIAVFIERLEEAPEWAKLLVAHIYLDHIVTQCLKDQLFDADLYLKGFRAFAEKVVVCQSLGFFRGEFGLVLNAVNAKRNKFAHNLDFGVTEKDKKELFRVFSQSRPLSDVLDVTGFDSFLSFVVIFAEYERVAEKKKALLSEEEKKLMGQIISFAKSITRSDEIGVVV